MQNAVTLAYGLVMLYNIRNRSPYNNIQAPPDFNWGSIYDISPFGGGSATYNQWVLYNGKDAICQLAFGRRHQYPIIEQVRIVTTEIPTP